MQDYFYKDSLLIVSVSFDPHVSTLSDSELCHGSSKQKLLNTNLG